MVLNARVLVVDDDPDICELLQEYLTQAGFFVDVVADGKSLFHYLEHNEEPNLVLLDVMLPDSNGFHLCKKIRENSLVPIIMLTAVSDEADQIEGLEIGADDYIAKPFNPRQLIARMTAVLRRVQLMSDKREIELPKQIIFGDWVLDTLSQVITHSVSKESYSLSGGEFSLLILFLTHPKEVLDKNTISYTTRGREALPTERGIDVQISRLRQRLGNSKDFPVYIKTMRGSGYILAVPVSYER
ncbi:response regulator [Vibrio salinus]|uniref:response regulator n=1 Tax=Vibrio salinus TaxID=2899784 RepID=UPI001E49A90E|nr:response regulator transcription factor [Vibrio salinus]MCE0492893.1 response regulator transcription factor [Vibrio salinus]